jgi:hypothetical protein
MARQASAAFQIAFGTPFVVLGGICLAGAIFGDGGALNVVGGSLLLLLGVGAAGAGVGQLMARGAFSQLTLEPLGRSFPLGGVARVRLVLEPKKPMDVNGASIVFKTIEKAVYSAGTDSRTYTDTLHEWTEAIALPSRLVGRIDHVIEIPIPRRLPPTFAGRHNSFISSCEVHVDLANWPDLDLNRELVIAAEYA